METPVTVKLSLREANIVASQLRQARDLRANLLEQRNYPDTVRDGETKASVRRADQEFIVIADDILRKLGA